MRSVGTTLEWDEQAHRDYAMQAWERGGGEASNLGMARQIGAIINSGRPNAGTPANSLQHAGHPC
ncbi:hypothetical protein P4050_19045 [Pseudomonas aeruginosa]|nr:hypothetical protein [Pseudomonas aeruginosa]